MEYEDKLKQVAKVVVVYFVLFYLFLVGRQWAVMFGLWGGGDWTVFRWRQLTLLAAAGGVWVCLLV